ncbi:hypothetical protein GYMLUDRAFT_67860 [Collybiopsis luxurians FD-317 M1]|nr:hypothetical protein GYMLUDRAFT_67860 [Collybiopsis luxurians FD-317 M1]
MPFRLVDTSDLSIKILERFPPPDPYCILSHTWSHEEKTCPQLNGRASFPLNLPPDQRPGYLKVKGVCEVASQYKFAYIWIDFWCIDKSDPVQRSESLNAMYRYYDRAKHCFVHLGDIDFDLSVELDRQLRPCLWFKRGWTVLELLVPDSVTFYDRNWTEIGTREYLQAIISSITTIPLDAIIKRRPLDEFSIAQRISCFSSRAVTLDEDMTYCMMGILGVHIHPDYGIGAEAAFSKLLRKLLKGSDDQTIFAWAPNVEQDYGRLFARHPSTFKHSGDVIIDSTHDVGEAYSLTNKGLEITLKCASAEDTSRAASKEDKEIIGFLACAQNGKPLGIRLRLVSEGRYQRVGQLVPVTSDPVPDHWAIKVIIQPWPRYNGGKQAKVKLCVLLFQQSLSEGVDTAL